MAEAFGGYAAYYDLLYSDKDYGAECRFLQQAFRSFVPFPVRRILDVGSGTGSHTLVLGREGFDITGVDLSESMLARAREKAAISGLPIRFHTMDMRSLRLDATFDSAICMFAAMGYVVETEGVLATLKGIRAHLRPGGILVFDVWNGLAVMRVQPSERTKSVRQGNREVLRFVRPETDAVRHLVHNHYRLLAFEGDRVVEEVKETHSMRFFFPQEMSHYLTEAGFEILQICPAFEAERVLTETDWNMTVIARAKGSAK